VRKGFFRCVGFCPPHGGRSKDSSKTMLFHTVNPDRDSIYMAKMEI
jgi:hypothetical protein